MFKLEDLLSNYFEKEIISEYICEKCDIQRGVIKSQVIVALPEVLLLHVNRLSGIQKYKRLYHQVEFPFEDLSMSEFCDLSDKSESSSYDLVGLIGHFGSSVKGHFVAYCYEDKLLSWVEFNDLKAKIVTIQQMEDVLRENIYLLVFRRKTKQSLGQF